MTDCADLGDETFDLLPEEEAVFTAVSESTEALGEVCGVIDQRIETMLLPCLEANKTLQEVLQSSIQASLIGPADCATLMENKLTGFLGMQLEAACTSVGQITGIASEFTTSVATPTTAAPSLPTEGLSGGFAAGFGIGSTPFFSFDTEGTCNPTGQVTCQSHPEEAIRVTKKGSIFDFTIFSPEQPFIVPTPYLFTREDSTGIFQATGVETLCDVNAYVNLDRFAGAGAASIASIIHSVLKLPGISDGFRASLGPVLSPFLAMIENLYDTLETGLSEGVEEVARKIIGVSTCKSPAFIAGWGTRILIGFFDKYIGGGVSELGIPFEYASRVTCPTAFPDESGATDAYLANAIDKELLTNWLKINNVCPEPWDRIIEARRSKLKPEEIIAIWLRKGIDEADMRVRFRQLGYLQELDVDLFKQLSVFIPGPADIIGMMVRDVVDPNIVDRFNLDFQFDDKYQAELEEMGEAQGMDRETAKLFWRKHWRLPSPQQLSTMIHRLSRIPADGVELRQFIGQSESIKDDDGMEVRLKRVDINDVRTALRQDDFLDFWVDPMIAITFTPLTRVDIRRLLNIGEINEAEAEEAYLQIGYNKSNAELMVSFAENLKNRGIATELTVRLWKQEVIDRNEAERRLKDQGFKQGIIDEALEDAAGQQDNHSAVKLYAAGKIDRETAMQRLTDHGIADDMAKDFLDNAEFSVTTTPALEEYLAGTIKKAQSRQEMIAFGLTAKTVDRLIRDADMHFQAMLSKDCLAAAKQRFLDGDVDANGVRNILRGLNLAPDFLDIQVQGWQCLREARGKLPSTSQLCQWLGEGTLTPAEFIVRLERLGYEPQDAARIIGSCGAKIRIKEQKELTRIAKEFEKLAIKDQKERARLEKETDTVRAKAEKGAAASKKAREKRKKAIIIAGDKLRDLTDTDLATAILIVEEAKNAVKDQLVLSEGLAVEAVTLAISKGKPATIDAFITEAFVIGQAIIDEANGKQMAQTNGSVNASG